jgi:hypothetical protein
MKVRVCDLATPTTGITGCCARAASGHAPAPPSSVMKSRRFISGFPSAVGLSHAQPAAEQPTSPWRRPELFSIEAWVAGPRAVFSIRDSTSRLGYTPRARHAPGGAALRGPRRHRCSPSFCQRPPRAMGGSLMRLLPARDVSERFPQPAANSGSAAGNGTTILVASRTGLVDLQRDYCGAAVPPVRRVVRRSLRPSLRAACAPLLTAASCGLCAAPDAAPCRSAGRPTGRRPAGRTLYMNAR